MIHPHGGRRAQCRRVWLLASLAGLACTWFGVSASASSAATTHRRNTGGGGSGSSSPRKAAETSSNWAGYVIMGANTPGSPASAFTSVSDRWIQPAANCTSSGETYSAFWVGLGGFADTAQGLEQIGTEADCTAAGRAVYSMWYEILPAASVRINLRVFPGNTIAASVKASGTKVTLQIKNLSRKTTFTKMVRLALPDLTSAEWIAEAPSACDQYGRCLQLPLTDFGTLSFTHAAATTADGHKGTINDAAWSSTTIELIEDTGSTFLSAQPPGSGALPSALSSDGTAFAVSWEAAPSPPVNGVTP